jgi:hypothetical protein
LSTKNLRQVLYYFKNLAPLRSAIGMLEWWNNGTMGFGKMGHGFIGKIPLDMGVRNIKI